MKPGRKKFFKFAAIGLAVILAASGVLYFTVFNKSRAASAGVQQRTSIVARGTLTNSIEGSGPVASSTRKEVSPKVTSTVEKVYFKEGDAVKIGDLMFELDDTDALLDIENTKNSLEQAQLTLGDNRDSIAALTIKAPFDGQISELNVKAGDSAGGAILKITDTSKLKLRVPFNGLAVSELSVGRKVTVNLEDLMQSVEGTVTYVSQKPYTSAGGGQLYNVEITIDNPGSLSEGMKANAEVTVGSTAVTSVQSGSLSYVNSEVLRSGSGATVKRVNVMNNDYVNAGDVLAELENDSLQMNLNSNELKVKNLQQQLAIQQEKLSYYKLTAPCNGTIISQDVALGDTASAGKALAVVADMDSLEFQVTIDELDISSIQVGQDVKITADALTETTDSPLTGKVKKISMEGNSSNGVTTYPVTISIDKNDKLKSGMNVNGEIITSSKSDILMVPVEAVVKMGNNSFIYVLNGDGAENSVQGDGNGFQRNFGANGSFNRRNGQANGGGTNESQTNGSQPAGDPSSGGQTNESQTNGSQPTGSQAGGNGSDGSRIGGSGNSGSGENRANTPSGGYNRNAGQPASGQTGANRSAPGQGDAGQPEASQPASGQSGTGQTANRTAGNLPSGARNANANSYYANATLVRVETGISNDTYIEITSGLTQGQIVVLPATTANSGSGSSSNQRNFGPGGFSGGGNFMMRAEPAGGR